MALSERQTLAVASGIALIIIVVFLAYLLPFQKQGEITYNGHNFAKKNGLWFTTVAAANKTAALGFRFTPYEVESVPVSGKFSNAFLKQKTYFTYSVGNQSTRHEVLGALELRDNIRNGLGVKLIPACTSNDTFDLLHCRNFAAVSCSSTNEPVIFGRPQKAEPGIDFSGNCVTVSGKDEDFHRAVDKLLYLWLDIMEYSGETGG